MIRSLVAGLLLALLAGPVQADPVPARLQHVLVYRNGANLEHSARVYLERGTQELLFSGISVQVDMNSVRLSTPGKITILSIGFSTDYLKTEQKSVLQNKLEDSLENRQQALRELQVMIRTNQDLLALLKANQQVGGSQNGMSVAELAKMVDYYKSKSLELEGEQSQYRRKEEKINGQIKKLREQIAEISQQNTGKGGQLLVRLLNPVAGTYDFRISYMTPAAKWNPGYDFRVDNTSKPVHVTYKAVLEQSTGIDWKQVKLSLATAAPRRQSVAPVFHSWFLSLVDPVLRMQQFLATNSIPSLRGKSAGLQEVVVVGYSSKGEASDEAAPAAASTSPLYVVDGQVVSEELFNRIDPGTIKSVESLDARAAGAIYGSRGSNGAMIVTLKEGLEDYITVKDNSLNVTYDIDVPYDVPSDGKSQYVTLQELDLPALYKYYSAPKLDAETYLLAEMSDWESLNLLPGEANIIVEDTYIGKTYIDPRSTADTLNLTLGQDKRVVVTREKLRDFSSIKFLGSNKKQVLTYEITVKNNKKEKLLMILKEQFPLSTNKDIEIELLEVSGASVNRETGVLTWTMELAPGASQKVRVSYSVKYPKDKMVDL